MRAKQFCVLTTTESRARLHFLHSNCHVLVSPCRQRYSGETPKTGFRVTWVRLCQFGFMVCGV